MEYVNQAFGDITIGVAIVFIAAVAFIVRIIIRLYKVIIANHDFIKSEQEMFKSMQEEIKDINSTCTKLTRSMEIVSNNVKVLETKLDDFETKSKAKELNRLRDILLTNYRYYTNADKNPMMAWSEMEKDSFDRLFADYEELDGDGFMHSSVQPAMEALDVIPMSDKSNIIKLMTSRK